MENFIKKNRALAAKRHLFTLILALIAGAGTVFAETVASGTCGADGDNLTWTLEEGGLLTISGSGAMAGYGIDTHPTWYDYITSIKEVEIGNSVTNIGRLMFYQCTNLTSVKIGESVKSIGGGAFYECSG